MDHIEAVVPLGGIARLSPDKDTNTAVIFVHGFKGHPLKTWGALADLACSDSSDFWQRSDLFFFYYRAEELHIDSSAHKLARYIGALFPTPPAEMFERSLKKHDWTLSLSLRFARVRPAPYTYSNLYLVGHSLGGVVIRRCIADELQPFSLAPGVPTQSPFFIAITRLFAPAHLGFKPSGWTGAAFNVSQQLLLGRVLEATMYTHRAYAHLKPDSRTIKDLRAITETLASHYPSAASLSAHLLWGDDEQIVEPGRYVCDMAKNEHYEPGKGHRDICKPTRNFRRPLEFIERDITGA
jgi:Alpha/beta hydrolase family